MANWIFLASIAAKLHTAQKSGLSFFLTDPACTYVYIYLHLDIIGNFRQDNSMIKTTRYLEDTPKFVSIWRVLHVHASPAHVQLPDRLWLPPVKVIPLP